MKITQNITLDIENITSYRCVISAKQNDNATREICAALTKDGRKYEIPSGATAKIRCAKPDGHFCQNNATADPAAGTVTFILTEQMLACPGRVLADIALSHGEKLLSTASFTILVEQIPGGDGIESFNELLELEHAVMDSKAAAEQALDAAARAQKGAEQVAEKTDKREVASAITKKMDGKTVIAQGISPLAHEVKCRLQCANLIPYPYENSTFSAAGATYTDNGDGSITINGNLLAGQGVYFRGNHLRLPVGIYTLSAEQSSPHTRIWLEKNSNPVLIMARGDAPYRFEVADPSDDYYLYFNADPGMDVENGIIKPQLTAGRLPEAFHPIPDYPRIPVYVKTPDGKTKSYAPEKTGEVKGITSVSPTMEFSVSSPDISIFVEYNVDTGYEIHKSEALFTKANEVSSAMTELLEGRDLTIEGISSLTHELSCSVVGENRIRYPYEDSTYSKLGITYVNNGDGSVTVNGNLTPGYAVFFNCGYQRLAPGSYVLSAEQTSDKTRVKIERNGTPLYSLAPSDPPFGFEVLPGDEIFIYIQALSGYDISNAIVRPQITAGVQAHEFTPIPDYTKVSVEVTDSHNKKTTFHPDAFGMIHGIRSVSPAMRLRTDTPGILIQAQYNADTKAAMDKTIASSPVKFRAMSHNVWQWGDDYYLHTDDFVSAWRKAIGSADADFIGMQEYFPEIADQGNAKSAELLFANAYHVFDNSYTGVNYPGAVATKAELHRCFAMELTYNRYLVLGYITLGGREICVASTHLSITSEVENQNTQIEKIIDRLSKEKYFILAGDFNREDFSCFTNAGFKVANHGWFGAFVTYDDAGHASPEQQERIDNIIVSPSIKITNVCTGDHVTSDHIPLIADLYIE